MKTVTLPLEFVKEAHKAACNDWKKRIEEHVPELAEPKTGWYWWEKNLVYYNNGEKTYGFWDGRWRDNLSFSFLLDNKIPASDKEVETALIAEAEKRGFKEGNYKGLDGLDIDSKFTGWYYQSYSNKLFSAEEGDGGDIIFHNGKWAEKIDNPIP